MVCEYGKEQESRTCGDQWLFGDSIIVSPLSYPKKEREVWLPHGEWYDFFTGEKFAGGGKHTRKTDGIPVYVKAGTLLPVAEPVSHVERDTCFAITLYAYGDCKDAVCRLVEDDGETHSTAYRLLEYTLENMEQDSFRYKIVGEKHIV